MSPRPTGPAGAAILGRIALRRVAVPVQRPRVFQVFEDLCSRALAATPSAGPSDRAPAAVR